MWNPGNRTTAQARLEHHKRQRRYGHHRMANAVKGSAKLAGKGCPEPGEDGGRLVGFWVLGPKTLNAKVSRRQQHGDSDRA